MISKKQLVLPLALVIAFAACGKKDDAPKKDEPVKKDDPGKKVDKEPGDKTTPTDGKTTATKVFWGDTHLHTSFSPDASLMNNVRLGPNEAFRFARGEEVEGNSGQKAKLARPLDFLVVSDHAEYMGLVPQLRARNAELMKNPAAKRWADDLEAGGDRAIRATLEVIDDIGKAKPRLTDPGLVKTTWERSIKAADDNNVPGTFTAFIGYEYTSMPLGKNLHRVVIFKDSADKAGKIAPFTAFDSENPEDLWKFLAKYEESTGGEILAIAHNGNVSNGIMFQMTDYAGKPITEAYAKERMRWEPLYEVTQIKGDGEAHPFLSPNDEFADYETWDHGSIDVKIAKKDEMLQYEYARSALRNGMVLEQTTGTNPYKFGMIGSTDAHTSLAAVAEANYWGKFAIYEPSSHRANHVFGEKGKNGMVATVTGAYMAASGYAAVWAPENTREALFAAMKRKETYATTGTRMTVRVFGGWDFSADDINRKDLAAHGYATGVPMGGDLMAAAEGRAPGFLIQAARDPDGAHLDRVQVIKGWVDKDGKSHERIYDVAVSGGRTIGEDGRCKTPVGNTVDVANATYKNTIGAAELSVHWADPEFDASQRAFYYVRVLEIPTPRWTAYDAKSLKAKMPKGALMQGQERAYTSPIWYTPAK